MRFLLTILFITTSVCYGDEYRYNLMATTGLQERIFDKNGVEKMISFSPKSNPEARHILNQLLGLQGIHGTKGSEQWNGVAYEQAIILKGTLDPKVQQTASAPNAATAENYQEFILEDVVVRFPLTRSVPGKVWDTAYLETHFSFDTLFPDGIEFEGKKINLDQHTDKREQDAAGQPSARPESKPEANQKTHPKSERSPSNRWPSINR